MTRCACKRGCPYEALVQAITRLHDRSSEAALNECLAYALDALAEHRASGKGARYKRRKDAGKAR